MKKLFYTIFACFTIVLFGSGIWCQPMTMTVNNTGDGSDISLGDGVCEVTAGQGDCTLRAAMEEANNNGGFHDIINFNIPGVGVHTIMPGVTGAIPPVVGLPILTDNAGATIDGSTQPGALIGSNPPMTLNLLIEVKGQGYMMPPPALLMHGVWIMSDNNDIRGLVVNEFTGDGIRIEGTPTSTDNNLIYANIVGTDPSGGIDRGNATLSAITPWYAGISIIVPPCDENPVFTKNNIVRRNLVSGNGSHPTPVNRGEGVSITNCPPGDNGFNTVEYNFIGTDISGTAPLGNDSDGVTIAEAAHDNLIDNNVISSNGYSGVGINGLPPSPPITPVARYTINNTISNNIIGLDVNTSKALANGFQGVSIGKFGPITWGFAPSNTVTNNIIAFNIMNGVLVDEQQTDNANCDFNLISQNSIYSNGQLGIDLVSPSGGPTGVVTFNDPGDPDTGPNQEINFPVINSAVIGSSSTTISGTVDVPSPTTTTVEVFIAAMDPTNHGEGMTYLGSTTPTTAGNWSLTVGVLTTSNMLTSTSTDANNSSEFSALHTPVLPVELMGWKAELKESMVLLSWTTASEVNNKGFYLLKSNDGKEWNELCWIPGHGNSTKVNTYYFEDHYPFLGDNYYSLLQEDYDGVNALADIKYIYYSPDIIERIQVFPNPSSGIFDVQILNTDNDPVSIRIYDIIGRMYWSEDFYSGEMSKSWKRRFELQTKQVYILQVKMGKMLVNKKIVITN
ncbi:MAG: T9SS type A sorting domain-containing protein [Saprospiraceae bacterium]|nr:T9SS type A sorting domain-containing protein [Saprospiraceae bacterium]